MKKPICIVLGLIFIVCSFIGCSNGPTTTTPRTENSSTNSASGDVRILQLGHVNPSKEDDQYQTFARYFADNLKEISGGKFEIDIVSDSILGGERDMMEGMKMGTVDMAIITNLGYGSFIPQFMVNDLPYIFNTREEAYQILDDEEIFQTLSNLLYDQCDVKLLSWGEGGFRHTVNNLRPIQTVEDMKGMKIRLPENPLYLDTFKALGANPTTMAYSETFTAVQQKTVDGLEIPISSIYSSGYSDICSYLSQTSHFYSPLGMNISKSVWENLTEEEQGWFMDAAKKAAIEERKFVQEIESKFLAEMEQKGIAINTIENKSSFIEAVQPVYEQYKEQIGADFMELVFSKLGK